ncbi:hypothetical protein [Nocardioides sp. L-11A]|uniref:hypothetical protein n=1 Tax=Nocardioides sp. L-11A TaxID=3043848 RepID=UPI00249CB229|nr:hypothetical protein QJ852_22235 [Nocardioides sp. L-11A]
MQIEVRSVETDALAHLITMDKPIGECALCGNPLPLKTVRGRPRIYCSDHCRQLAYSERIHDRFETELNEPPPPMPVPGSLLDRWATEGNKFDEIFRDPYLLGRFMDDLMCRIAVDHILEDHRYQHAVNQLIVTFFMIGRMTDGDYQLPIIVQ